jgi:IS30 family transposase
LNVSPSTILREIKLNQGKRGYRYQQSDEKSVNRRCQASSKKRKLLPDVIDKIKMYLNLTQSSPVQISGYLFKNEGLKISHESIYRLIWDDKKQGGNLYTHLRHKAKKYNKRGAKNAGRGLIPNRVDIDQRPIIVEQKTRIGNFELDTIVGANHNGAIISIVDRCSKYAMLELVPQATKEAVREAIVRHLIPFKPNLYTLTSDNGKEFADHEKISKELGALFFFAKPYHSWERGLNEHTNGLVRQYFPKGTDFTILSKEQVANVEQRLNNRPRLVLDFNTPFERFLSNETQRLDVAVQC